MSNNHKNNKVALTPAEWQVVKQVFNSALEMEINERQKYLENVDISAKLKKEVDELLISFEDLESNKLMQSPLIAVVKTNNREEFKSVSLNADSLLAPFDQTLERDPFIGNTFAEQYFIEKKIAQGGTGVIYLAKHLVLNELRAIKLLLPEFQEKTEFKKRFIREAKATQKINHPNLIKTYELGKAEKGLLFLAMEYIDGVTLRDKFLERIKNNEIFSPKEAVDLISPILLVLQLAHSQGVIHRDIKPENILVGKNKDGAQIVKLTDLGIAKLTTTSNFGLSSAMKLSQGKLIGTPLYMCPEQWGEIPKDAQGEWRIDGRADIYSVGVILYELLSGINPFDSTDVFTLATKHVSWIPTPLNEICPQISRKLANVISKTLAKDRTKRQQTAQQLLDELMDGLEPELPSNTEMPSLLNQAVTQIKKIFGNNK